MSEPSTTARPESFGRNAAMTVATQFTVLALGLVASALISRALGPEGRGAYYLPVTTVVVSFSITHLSLEMATTYFYSERILPLAQLARVAATGAVVLGVIGLLALSTPYFLHPSGRIAGVRTRDLALAACALPFIIHATWSMNLFVLSGRLPRSQAAVVIAAIFQTVALLALGAADAFTVDRVLGVYVASAIVTWLLLAIWSRGFAPPVPTTDRALLSRVVGHGLKMHLGWIAFYLLVRSDVYLVNGLLTLRDVGLYSLAVLFAELVWTVSAALAVAALPFQSSADAVAGAAATLRAVRVCLMVSAALSIACVSTLWFVFPLLYGHAFASAYGPMVVLLPGICAMTMVRPLWNWLLREGRPTKIVVLFVGGFLSNVALNLLLLPRIGLYGASVSSSVAYVVIAVVMARWALANTGGRPRDLIPGRDDLSAAVGPLTRVLARRRPRASEATISDAPSTG